MAIGRRIGLILNVLAAVLVAFVVVTLACGAYLYTLSLTLPDLDSGRGTVDTPRTSIVYAADGSVLAEWHGEQDRTVVAFEDIPPYVRNAVVAIEDERFYKHNGVDTEAILRALRVNSVSGEVRQGGSTITQQLVKILFTDGERTLTRKIREVLLAYELEAKADKDDVLETYLNTVYFGNGAYGIESAAQHYFGKPAASLTVAEGALLAGVIRSPSRYSPIDNPDAAKGRRDLVLEQMERLGHLTEDQARKAARTPVKLAPPDDVPDTAPYFVEYVKQDLIERLGADRVYGGGLRVYTTLDPNLQRAAERATKLLSQKGDPEVALAAVRHSDGGVVALVGGRDFKRQQFNLATQGLRQPGSAFKTFVLVAALEEGVSPQRVFSAAPYSVRVKDGVWKVQNYENARTSGTLTLQAATNWSVNAVYARLIMEVGPKKVAAVAKRMGIVTPIDPNPAIALGGLTRGVSPLEMASAYGTLANNGIRIAPHGIVRVTDDKGRMVYEPEVRTVRALSKGVAVQTSLILHEVVEGGTGTEARIGKWAAGKTGTTQSYRDAWFVGWSGDVATSVWVGYPEAQVDMTDVHGIKVTGGSYPARIWARFMKSVIKESAKPVTPSQGATVTQGVRVLVCDQSMALANRRCTNAVEVYLSPESVPEQTCELH